MCRKVNKSARVKRIKAKVAPIRTLGKNASGGMITTIRETNPFVRGFAASMLALSALASAAHAAEEPWPALFPQEWYREPDLQNPFGNGPA
jgi:hypothetical protein